MKSILYSPKAQIVSRIIMAALFVFSGLAKSLNPFGLSLQFGDYFGALGLNFLRPLSPLCSILLPSLELLLGLMLAIGIGRKITAWGVTIFMAFFTLLTLWIAIYNPVSDCGCFGDILKLSNWQTFWKNIFFTPFYIIIFLNRKIITTQKHILLKYIVIIPLSFIVSIYASFSLPIIDATPFKIGVNIPQAMEIPVGAPQTEYNTVLIYKNLHTGNTQQFSIDDPTWQDAEQWEYVDTKNEIITQGYIPPIASFPILNTNGEDISNDILQQKGMLLLIVTNFPLDIDGQALQVLSTQVDRTILLTSAPLKQLQPLKNIEFYNSDYSFIYTLIQHKQGGAVLIQDGTIIYKWPMLNLPARL